MTKLRGNNTTLPLRRLMIERGNYKRFAYSERGGLGPKNVLDFNFAERTQYGKVDTKGNPMLAKQDKLVPVTSLTDSSNTIMLQNFMASAFTDFVNHMNRARQLRIINNDHPYLAKINAVRGYTSPVKNFREYMEAQSAEFNDIFLRNSGYLPRILNFGQYCKHIVEFMEIIGENFPITFTGYHRSKNSDIFSSGFAVDIAGLDISDDAPKDELFLKDSNFPFYLRVARYYGLVIAKNAPHIIAADLSSPAMLPYMRSHDVFNIEDVFDENFTEARFLDIQIMKELLLQGYNDFVRLFPRERKIRVCSKGHTHSRFEPRTLKNIDSINKEYNYAFFNNIYIDLRNIEERKPFRTADLRRIKRNANYYYRVLGESRAMLYVNEQFRQLYKFKSGSTFDVLKKIKLKKQAQNT